MHACSALLLLTGSAGRVRPQVCVPEQLKHLATVRYKLHQALVVKGAYLRLSVRANMTHTTTCVCRVSAGGFLRGAGARGTIWVWHAICPPKS